MAAMLSSCTTLLSSCTTLLSSAPGKSSPAAALQLRSRRHPAAAAAAVPALRWDSRKEYQSRAALFACHAQKPYDIEPSALVHPRPFDGTGSDWSLVEDNKRIILSFNVGESTTVQDLEVATTEDQTLLGIRNKNKNSSSSPASSLDVHLLMPPGYDSSKIQATLRKNAGWLDISIPKPKHEPNEIPITPIPTKPNQ